MKTFTHRSELFVPRSLAEVFEFFAYRSQRLAEIFS
jgi:hypothetical protein